MPREAKLTFLTPKLHTSNLKEGANILRQIGDVKLIAEVKNGKIRSLSATDAHGKHVQVSTLRQSVLPKPGATAGAKLKCFVCVLTPGGARCYEISCDDLPAPKPAPSKQ